MHFYLGGTGFSTGRETSESSLRRFNLHQHHETLAVRALASSSAEGENASVGEREARVKLGQAFVVLFAWHLDSSSNNNSSSMGHLERESEALRRSGLTNCYAALMKAKMKTITNGCMAHRETGLHEG